MHALQQTTAQRVSFKNRTIAFDRTSSARAVAKGMIELLSSKNRTITSDRETPLYFNMSIGAVCAGQREPKSHRRADVRTAGNQRSGRRVHASGEYHRRQENPEVRFKECLDFISRNL